MFILHHLSESIDAQGMCASGIAQCVQARLRSCLWTAGRSIASACRTHPRPLSSDCQSPGCSKPCKKQRPGPRSRMKAKHATAKTSPKNPDQDTKNPHASGPSREEGTKQAAQASSADDAAPFQASSVGLQHDSVQAAQAPGSVTRASTSQGHPIRKRSRGRNPRPLQTDKQPTTPPGADSEDAWVLRSASSVRPASARHVSGSDGHATSDSNTKDQVQTSTASLDTNASPWRCDPDPSLAQQQDQPASVPRRSPCLTLSRLQLPARTTQLHSPEQHLGFT